VYDAVELASEVVMRDVTFSAEKVPAGTVTVSTPLTVKSRVKVYGGLPVVEVTVEVVVAVAPGVVLAGNTSWGGEYLKSPPDPLVGV
jgi:hypothetical protein